MLINVYVMILGIMMIFGNNNVESRTGEIQTTSYDIEGARFVDEPELVFKTTLKNGRVIELYNGDVEELYLWDGFKHPLKATYFDTTVIYIDGHYYELENLETDPDADEIYAALNHWR